MLDEHQPLSDFKRAVAAASDEDLQKLRDRLKLELLQIQTDLGQASRPDPVTGRRMDSISWNQWASRAEAACAAKQARMVVINEAVRVRGGEKLAERREKRADRMGENPREADEDRDLMGAYKAARRTLFHITDMLMSRGWTRP